MKDDFNALDLKKKEQKKYNSIMKQHIETVYTDCINKINIYNNNNINKFVYEILPYTHNISINIVDTITIELNKILKKKKFKTILVLPNKIIIEW